MSPLVTALEASRLLRLVMGSFELFDASFPNMYFLWDETRVVALRSESTATDAEDKFYSRFRQWGGSRDITTLRAFLSGQTFSFGSDSFQPDASRLLALSFHDFTIHQDLIFAAGFPISILCYGDSLDEFQTEFSYVKDLEIVLSFELNRGNSRNIYVLLAKRGVSDAKETLFAAEAKKIGSVFATRREFCGTNVPYFKIELSAEAKVLHSIQADRFIHDGTRIVEKHETYHWLWIGHELQIRILIGALPVSIGTLRIVIPNAHDSENLRSVIVLLDGICIPIHIEAWKDGAGAIIVQRELLENRLVLGISVKNARQMNSGEFLSASIDKIELCK